MATHDVILAIEAILTDLESLSFVGFAVAPKDDTFAVTFNGQPLFNIREQDTATALAADLQKVLSNTLDKLKHDAAKEVCDLAKQLELP